VLDRDAYFGRWTELHGGYDPAAQALSRTWLTAVHAVACRCGPIPPAAVTVAGLLVAAAVPVLALGAGPLPALLAAVAVLLSGLLDSLDGAVAVTFGRDTRLGFVLDSLADRIADSAYVVALWVLGAPGWLCVLAGAVTALQEYIRARAGAAGMSGIGVVTVWERPTRIVLAAVLLALSAVPAVPDGTFATAGAGGWSLLAVIGVVQVLAAVRRELG